MNVGIPKFPAFFTDVDKAVIGAFLNFKKYPNCIRSFTAIVNESKLDPMVVESVLSRYSGIFLQPLPKNASEQTQRWHLQHEMFLLISLNSYKAIVDLELGLTAIVTPSDKNVTAIDCCAAVADATLDLPSLPKLSQKDTTTVEADTDTDEADPDADESQSFTA